MKNWVDEIKWADWCKYWIHEICPMTQTKCLWSDLGGYPINHECQFYTREHKNLTNGVKYDIIIEEGRK